LLLTELLSRPIRQRFSFRPTGFDARISRLLFPPQLEVFPSGQAAAAKLRERTRKMNRLEAQKRQRALRFKQSQRARTARGANMLFQGATPLIPRNRIAFIEESSLPSCTQSPWPEIFRCSIGPKFNGNPVWAQKLIVKN
jgi:hypothetical protein